MVSSRLGWVDWNKHRRKKWLWKITVSSRLGWVDWNRRSISSISSLKRSHPVWDEWIEIWMVSLTIGSLSQSHPVWDEWIEIIYFGWRFGNWSGLIPFGMSGLKYSNTVPDLQILRLIPFGMSGLKYLRRRPSAYHPVVSSRLGWVDWNPVQIAGHDLAVGLIPFGMSGLK